MRLAAGVGERAARVAFAETIKLQNSRLSARPAPRRKPALGAFKVDMTKPGSTHYRQKRDFMLNGLRQAGYECEDTRRGVLFVSASAAKL